MPGTLCRSVNGSRIIGAGIGGSAGAVFGKKFDDQIKELDEAVEGTGVDVEEVGDQDAILVRLPDGVTFATNSADINPGFLDTLNAVAESLIKYPDSLVDVYGFTDTTGSASYNQGLSERRARVVASSGTPERHLAHDDAPAPFNDTRVRTSQEKGV